MRPQHPLCNLPFAWRTLILGFLFLFATLSHAITYTYDELGRLKAVTDNLGNTAEYVYDAVGNIVQVKQIPGGTVAITEFTPNQGSVGASVTIFGSGFSATPANNVVQFNRNKTATVTSASVNKLVVTVPAGAITGKISVKVGTVTATSVTDFVVTATSGVPTITSFTPACAAVGSNVTVTGTNFDLAPNGTKVEVGAAVVSATISSATSVSIPVPTGVASGKIRVVTAGGIATSATTLLIPPGSLTCADIISTTTLVADGATQTISIPTAGKNVVTFFEGTQNGYLSVQMSNYVHSTSGSVSYSVYGPDSTLLKTGSILITNLSIHLPALPKTGLYSIVFNPGALATASFIAKLENDAALVVDGAPNAKAITSPGQTARYTFVVNEGQTLGIGIDALVLTPSTATSVTISFLRDGATTIKAVGCYTNASSGPGCSLNLNGLTAGTYSIVVSPPGVVLANYNIHVNTDVSGTLAPGTAAPINLKSGQNARFTFIGTTGQSVALEFSQITTNPTGRNLYAHIYRPSDAGVLLSLGSSGTWGDWVSSTIYSSSPGGTVTLPTLPETGTYTVIVDTLYQETASLKLTLEPGTPLIIDATTPTPGTVTTTGESARFTFNASAGQNLGIGIQALTLAPSAVTYATVNIYRPDGAFVIFTTCANSSTSGPGCSLNLNNLVAGTYSILVEPNSGGTGGFSIQLVSDVVGTLQPNTAVAINLKSGQNARYTFEGTAGQNVALEFAQIATNPVGRMLTAYVYRPTDTIGIFSSSSSFSGYWRYIYLFATSLGDSLTLPQLPATGTYTVIIDTSYQETASLKLTLETGAAASIDAATPTSATIATVGESAYFTFAANAGQNLGIAINALALTPTTVTSASVTVYNSSGAQVTGNTCSTSATTEPGCSLNLNNLAGGIYSIVMRPASGATGSFNIQLVSDVIGALPPGTPTAITLNSGQNARYTFAGTAGQNVALEFAQIATNPTGRTLTGYVYLPTGTIGVNSFSSDFTGQWQSVSIPAAGVTKLLPVLPATGTYTVIVDTSYQETASLQITLETGTAFTIDAATPTAATIATAGESAYFTFTANAGQNLGIAINALALAPTTVTSANVTVYTASGAAVTSNSCSSSATSGPGCSLNLNNLAAGTYSIVVQPAIGATGSFNIQLNSDVTGTLSPGVAAPISLKSGQNGRYTFAGTAGQNVALEFAQVVTNPTGRTLTGYVYLPTGTIGVNSFSSDFTGQWQSVSIPAAGVTKLLPVLPATGTYTVIVDTSYQETASLQLTLETGSGLTIDAATPATATIAATGDSAYFTFTANAGQNLGIAITALALIPTTVTTAAVTVYSPSGAVVTANACSTSTTTGPGCSLNLNNLAGGIYSIVVQPNSSATGSFNIQLVSDVIGTLSSGVATTITLNSGQNARYTFAGTAGQNVALEFAQVVTVPTSRSLTGYVYQPTGTIGVNSFSSDFTGSWQSFSITSAGMTKVLPVLPATGTYTIIIDTSYQETASLQLTLETGSGLTIDAATPATATIAATGDSAYFTFTANAGQNLGIAITALALIPTTVTTAAVTVYSPSGTAFTSINCSTSTTTGPGCSLNLNSLAGGTYSIVLQPNSGAIGSFSIQLNSDITGTLSPSVAVPITLKPGQNARYTFAGTAGQTVAVEFAQIVTNPSGRTLTGYVYRPTDTISGSSLSSDFFGSWQIFSTTSGGVTKTLPILPATGTYTVIVNTDYQETASLQLTLETGTALTIDATTPTAATIATTGETALFTFNAVAGQNLGLGMTGLTLAPVASTSASMTVYKPDATVLSGGTGSCLPSGTQCALNIGNLPVAGIYSIVVAPVQGGTGNFGLSLSNDLTGALTIGSAATVNITRPGQNARYSFSGTAAQLLRLSVSSLATTPAGVSAAFTIMKPDGTTLAAPSTAIVPFAFDIVALPLTGTYTVLVEPLASGKGAATLSTTMTISPR